MNELMLDKVNPLEDLKSEATEVLRRALFMSRDEKTTVKLATDILNNLKDTREDASRPIVIKDSQIQILLQVSREAFGG
jgi:hypothetical protein